MQAKASDGRSSAGAGKQCLDLVKQLENPIRTLVRGKPGGRIPAIPGLLQTACESARAAPATCLNSLQALPSAQLPSVLYLPAGSGNSITRNRQPLRMPNLIL